MPPLQRMLWTLLLVAVCFGGSLQSAEDLTVENEAAEPGAQDIARQPEPEPADPNVILPATSAEEATPSQQTAENGGDETDCNAECESVRIAGKDLTQQTRMADSTAEIASDSGSQIVIGWLGLGLNLVGIGLLLWTLCLTRKSVEDAGMAVAAARDSNEIMQGAAKNQLRAYMTPIRTIHVCSAERGLVSVKWSNSGQTPALGVRVAQSGSITYLPPSRVNPNFGDARDNFKLFMPTAIGKDGIAGHDFALKAGEIDAISSQNATCYIHTVIEYRDIFKRWYFCESTNKVLVYYLGKSDTSAGEITFKIIPVGPEEETVIDGPYAGGIGDP